MVGVRILTASYSVFEKSMMPHTIEESCLHASYESSLTKIASQLSRRSNKRSANRL